MLRESGKEVFMLTWSGASTNDVSLRMLIIPDGAPPVGGGNVPSGRLRGSL